MNPDPLQQTPPTGPIELKPGELARPISHEQRAQSARSLIAALPNPHEAPEPEVNQAVSKAAVAPELALEASPALTQPASAPARLQDLVAATGSEPTPQTLAEQRAMLNPLATAAPVVPARSSRPPKSSLGARPRGAGGLPSRLRPVLTAIATFSLLLFLFKLPVVISQIKYLTQKPAVTLPVAGSVSDVVPADPTITIPKINVHAPVVYEPSVAEANVQKALQSGIDHYGNTPAPGQGGNSVFFGHSSNDWWEPGNYKFVFVLLDKLAPGDQFSIDYQSHRYVYQVTGSRVVEPTDLSVLNQTPNPTVTLITCTPPGTSWKRLIVTANQIQPDPAKAQTTATAPSQQSLQALPGSPSSISSQLGQAVSGLWHGITHLFGHDNSGTPAPSPTPSAGGTLPGGK